MGATKILTGTIRTRNGKRRIVFRVIDAASGVVVARRITEVNVDKSDWKPLIELAAAELRAAIGNNAPKKAKPESSVPAAREYLHTGKEYYYRYNPADTKTSQYYFAKAIEADPQCAEAQAMFALSWSRRFQQAPDEFSDDNYAKAIGAATVAVRLNPELALGYRAHAALLGRTDPAQSQEPALCALELEPDDVVPAGQIGFAWRMLGRPDLALRWLARSSSRGQRPGMNSAAVADALTELGEDDAAEQAYNQRLEFWPDVPDAHVGLARLWMYHGDFLGARNKAEEAVTRYRDHCYPRQMLAILKLFQRDFPAAEADYRKLVETDRHGGTTFYCCISNLSALGFLRRQAGDIREGEQLLAEAQKNQAREVSKAPANRELLYDLAASHAAMDDPEECFDTLNRALRAGWIDHRALSLDPRFDSVRGDQRFTTMVKELAQKVAALKKGKQPVGELAQNIER
jgi:Tfp pilus assembly protein PilF